MGDHKSNSLAKPKARCSNQGDFLQVRSTRIHLKYLLNKQCRWQRHTNPVQFQNLQKIQALQQAAAEQKKKQQAQSLGIRRLKKLQKNAPSLITSEENSPLKSYEEPMAKKEGEASLSPILKSSLSVVDKCQIIQPKRVYMIGPTQNDDLDSPLIDLDKVLDGESPFRRSNAWVDKRNMMKKLKSQGESMNLMGSFLTEGGKRSDKTDIKELQSCLSLETPLKKTSYRNSKLALRSIPSYAGEQNSSQFDSSSSSEEQLTKKDAQNLMVLKKCLIDTGNSESDVGDKTDRLLILSDSVKSEQTQTNKRASTTRDQKLIDVEDIQNDPEVTHIRNFAKLTVGLPKSNPYSTSCTPIQSPLVARQLAVKRQIRPSIDVQKVQGNTFESISEPRQFFSSRQIRNKGSHKPAISCNRSEEDNNEIQVYQQQRGLMSDRTLRGNQSYLYRSFNDAVATSTNENTRTSREIHSSNHASRMQEYIKVREKCTETQLLNSNRSILLQGKLSHSVEVQKRLIEQSSATSSNSKIAMLLANRLQKGAKTRNK